MAVTIDRVALAKRLRIGQSASELEEVDSLLAYTTEAVTNHAPDAPDVGPNAAQGTNTDNELGWSGPCPPAVVVDAGVMKGRSAYLPSAVHDHSVSQYYFRLYALDIDLQLDSGATKEAFLKAIDGHVLAGGELVGEQIASPTKTW